MSVRQIAIRTVAPALVVGASLALIASPAQARSNSIDYLCDLKTDQGVMQDMGLSMTFDTPLKNGGTVRPGQTVDLSRIDGVLVLSQALSQSMIEAAGSNDSWSLQARIDVPEIGDLVGAQFEPQSTPARTPIDTVGIGGSFTAQGSDVFTVRAGSITLAYPMGEPPTATAKCDVVDGQDRTIDRVHLATKSQAPAPASTPERPALVQTDAAQTDVAQAAVAQAAVAKSGVTLAGTPSADLAVAATPASAATSRQTANPAWAYGAAGLGVLTAAGTVLGWRRRSARG